MFDLEKSIIVWKRSFQQSCSLADERIEELESHLREAIVGLSRKGLNDEEGFLIATKRLGKASVLAAEYEKNGFLGANRDRLVWMLSGYLGISLCGIFSTALVSSLSAGMAFVGAGAMTTGIIMTLVQVLFWITMLVVACRVDNAPFVSGGFSSSWLAVMFAAMIALPFVNSLARALQATFVEPTWQVATYYWVGYGQIAIQLLIYAFCFGVLYKVRRSSAVLAA